WPSASRAPRPTPCGRFSRGDSRLLLVHLGRQQVGNAALDGVVEVAGGAVEVALHDLHLALLLDGEDEVRLVDRAAEDLHEVLLHGTGQGAPPKRVGEPYPDAATTGWAPRSLTSTTRRFFTISAFRVSSMRTMSRSSRDLSTPSTMLTAPSTMRARAARMAAACWRWSMAPAISVL